MAAAATPARQTRGRQKIPMKLIQNQDDLYASFSKRRFGLFKKGSELSTLCGADIGIIVFSPTDNPFSFFSPSMESVIERYINPDQSSKHSARAIDAHARSRIQDLNKQLDLLLEQKLKLKEMDEGLAEIDRTREKGWWEETSVESLDKEQVGVWIAWFKDFKDRVENEIQKHPNGGSSSSMNDQLQSTVLVAPSIQNYFAPPPAAAEQFGGLQHYGDPVHDQDAAAAASGLLNLCGGGGGGDDLLRQCYYPSPPPPDMYGGGGESSQYFYGQSSSQGASSPYFSPPYRYYVAPGGYDPFGAGGSGSGGGGDENLGGTYGQYDFPPTLSTYMVDTPSSVGETGQHSQGVNQSTSFCVPPDYGHIPSGAQHPSDDHAAENNEDAAPTSDDQGGED